MHLLVSFQVLRRQYSSSRRPGGGSGGGGGGQNGRHDLLNAPAPVTYIGLHEDVDLSIGVFIINPRGRMPLHNHPGMHGILKVVHGTVEVAFYNRVKQLQIPQARLHILRKTLLGPCLLFSIPS